MKRALLLVVAACSGGPKSTVQPSAAPVPAAAPAAQRMPEKPTRQGPPIAAVRVVKDVLHGVTVEDPYRWLESDDADVKKWSDAQNTYARGILDNLPDVNALRGEITAIMKAPITRYGGFRVAGAYVYGFRKEPTKEQAELIVFADPEKIADAKVVVDPTEGGHAHRSIDWIEPSPDGSKVAVSISEKGSERGDLHIFGRDGKLVDVVIPNVNRGTGGGDVAWTPDGKGFYYTRYPAKGEKPDAEADFWMQAWFHEIGTPVEKDHYELGKDFPKIAELVLEADKKGRVLAKVQNGDGGEFRHYLRDAKGAWRQLDDWNDRITYLGFGTTDDLWAVSTKDAPNGKVLAIPASAKSSTEGKVVIAEGKDAIVTEFFQSDFGVVDGGDRLYVLYQVGGPTELRAFTRAGKGVKSPALPPVSSVSRPILWKNGGLVGASSYTTPFAWYRFDGKSGGIKLVQAISPKPPVDLTGFEARRELATSKDGTKIPYTVIWPKNAKQDGSTPCIATGYGGYNISQTPYFATWIAPLLKRGFCLVETNLRGGGEYGEAWHRAGMLTAKQNVFDDFAAVLQALVANKYTSTPKLGIIGGSNGGLLMGATFVQHPELVKAVVAEVAIFDSVRAEDSPNGEYNVTEFGTVKNEAHFAALLAYSPYHHVAKANYPAILMTTGDHDPRVPPWHSRKMTARLQAMQAGNAPILLRTSSNAGHGIGSSMTEQIDQLTHTFAFLLDQLRER
jgi:prolyl oligopeptidase